MKAEFFTLAVNLKTMRPACVLLQAALGGQGSSEAFQLFHYSTWETHYSPEIKLVRGTLNQWKTLAERVNKHGQSSLNQQTNPARPHS